MCPWHHSVQLSIFFPKLTAIISIRRLTPRIFFKEHFMRIIDNWKYHLRMRFNFTTEDDSSNTMPIGTYTSLVLKVLITHSCVYAMIYRDHVYLQLTWCSHLAFHRNDWFWITDWIDVNSIMMLIIIIFTVSWIVFIDSPFFISALISSFINSSCNSVINSTAVSYWPSRNSNVFIMITFQYIIRYPFLEFFFNLKYLFLFILLFFHHFLVVMSFKFLLPFTLICHLLCFFFLCAFSILTVARAYCFGIYI